MKKYFLSLAILWFIQLTSTAAIGRDLINLQRQDSKTVSAMVFMPTASECKGIELFRMAQVGLKKATPILAQRCHPLVILL